MYDEDLKKRLGVLFLNAKRVAQEFWEETEGNSLNAYGKVHAIFNELCDAVSRQRETAYPMAAELVADMVCCEEVPRELRSVILTALARWPYDYNPRIGTCIKGRSVAHFAEVLNLTSGICAEVYVEWFEDMGSGIAVRGGEVGEWVLQPQPTRVMRGVLFDARLQNRGMTQFWELATESDRFPVQLFTDPGDNDACSCYLTTEQMRQMSSFIALAPEEAVMRFATAFRDRVLTMETIIYVQIMLPGGHPVMAAACDKGERDVMRLFSWLGLTSREIDLVYEHTDIKVNKIPVQDENRERILRTVVERIGNRERRQLAETIFFGSDEPDEGGKKE